MTPRKFYLRNEYGQEFDMNDPKKAFFYQPKGLGYHVDTSYSRIGTLWVRNFLHEKQEDVSGTMEFLGDSPYVVAQEFQNFVNLASSLQLRYETPAGTYYKDVDVVSYDKGEIDTDGILKVAIKFRCKGLYYDNYIDRYTVKGVEGELRYNYRYPARFNDYVNRRLSLVNDGHVEATFTAAIHGYCENPTITITQNKKQVAYIRFPIILEEGDVLYYSNVAGNLYCYYVRSGTTEEVNFVGELDINNDNFFKIPIGEFTMQFASDTASTNKTVVTIYKYYRAV